MTQDTRQHSEEDMSPGRRYVTQGKIFPNYEHVDWKSAPLPYKLYNNCEYFPLGYDDRIHKDEGIFSHDRLGQMLNDIYGTTRQRLTSTVVFNATLTTSTSALLDPVANPFRLELLRPVPSGGGLFPCELYLVMGEGLCLPEGIYHYDALHHAFDCISLGTYLPLLQNSVSHLANTSVSFAFLLTCSFWKNAFKYGEFSYRLHSMDLGIVLTQCLEVSQRYRWQGTVHYQFIDATLNEMLGLQTAYESTYAAMLFTEPHLSTQERQRQGATLSRKKPAKCSRKDEAQPISIFPLLDALHTASLISDKQEFRPPQSVLALRPPSGVHQVNISDDAMLRLLDGKDQRHSARFYFQPEPISAWQFAQLLHTVGRGYTNDIDGKGHALCHTLIYCLVNNVRDIEPGIYCYTPAEQTLLLIQQEDLRSRLQHILVNTGYHNTHHVSVYLFLVGCYQEGLQVYGDRWYRIQNMEAGIAIQRLYLASATLGLGCHTSLAYPVNDIDHLLHLPKEFTTLAQIMIAPEFVSGQYYEIPTCL